VSGSLNLAVSFRARLESINIQDASRERRLNHSLRSITVIDPRTDIVVLTGKLSSLGGTLATKIAKRLIEQMREVRP
jgi:hypothetical protein